MAPRIVILRGPAVSVWDLRPWELLTSDFDVEVLVPTDNLYDTSGLCIARAPVGTLGARMPGGPLGRLVMRAVGERYVGLREHLVSADVVHAAELGYWFSCQAARLKPELGYKLALTVWETLPFREAYRNVRTRRYRRETLRATDLFLATTERAREALLLEDAAEERIRVCPPGIDVDRFATPADVDRPSAGASDLGRLSATASRSGTVAGTHLVLSVGRLVWEKGHQDLLRALALLRRRGRSDVRVEVVGAGPELRRLRRVAADLGLSDIVAFRGNVPYDELPQLYARASCLVLASLPTPFWEEQFGMVLAEALAARLPIVACSSGAIPEVVGDDAMLVAPGDWVGLADALEAGPLSSSPGSRSSPAADRVERFSTRAAAARLRAAYEDLLAS